MTTIKSTFHQSRLIMLLFLFVLNFFNSVYAQDTLRVLFIGNSMTYVQDLPGLLTNLASSNGKTIITSQNTPGGYFLSDHVTNPLSLSLMAQNFDFIVVQEQSGGNIQPALPSPEITRPIEIIDSIAKSNCSKLLLYATPGYPETYSGSVYTYEVMQANIINNYSLTAQSVRALCLPTAHAFRDVIRNYPGISDMWASLNDYHPGIKGQYLHACVLYSVLFNETALGSPAPIGISESEASMLQQTAWNFTKDSSLQFGYHFLDTLVTGFQKNITGSNVIFKDTSSSFINRIDWDFGDSSGIVISEPVLFQEFGLVNHSYSDLGCYLVKRNLYWSTCETKIDSILICLNSTSVSEVMDINSIYLYPNPAIDKLYLKWESLNDISVAIHDSKGQKLKTAFLSNQNKIVDISELENGLYFLKISDGHKIGMKKVIVAGK
jgi:PKD repeat protein